MNAAALWPTDEDEDDDTQEQWENEYQQWLAEQGAEDEGDFDE